MSDDLLYEVTFLMPFTVRVRARNEEDATRIALLAHPRAKAVGFPESITVKEVERVSNDNN